MTKWSFLIVSLLLLLTAFLTFCGVPEAAKEAGQAVERTGQSLERTGEKVRQAADLIRQIDPIALNRLLQSDEELREQVKALSLQLENASEGRGGVVLQGKEVLLEIPRHVGTLRVQAYIDSPERMALNRRLNDTEIRLGSNCAGILKATIDELRTMTDFGKKMESVIRYQIDGNGWEELANKCDADAEEKFRTFLKSVPVVPVEDFAQINLEDQFFDAGDHRIVVQVFVIEPNPQGRWSVQMRVVNQAPNGARKVLGDFDADDQSVKELPKDRAAIIVSYWVKVLVN